MGPKWKFQRRAALAAFACTALSRTWWMGMSAAQSSRHPIELAALAVHAALLVPLAVALALVWRAPRPLGLSSEQRRFAFIAGLALAAAFALPQLLAAAWDLARAATQLPAYPGGVLEKLWGWSASMGTRQTLAALPSPVAQLALAVFLISLREPGEGEPLASPSLRTWAGAAVAASAATLVVSALAQAALLWEMTRRGPGMEPWTGREAVSRTILSYAYITAPELFRLATALLLWKSQKRGPSPEPAANPQ